MWVDQGIMSKVQRNKLVFIETRDSGEITLALKNYFQVMHHIAIHLPLQPLSSSSSSSPTPGRPVTMAEVQCCWQLPEARSLKAWTLVSSSHQPTHSLSVLPSRKYVGGGIF